MAVKLDRGDLAKYPFTREAREYIKGENIDLGEMLRSPAYLGVMEYTYEKLVKIARGEPHRPSDDYMELVSFPLAIFTISVIGNDVFAQRFAVFEAKRAHFYLLREELEKVVHIARTTFGWDVRLKELDLEGRRVMMIATPIPVYLKYASGISGSFWSLVNQLVEDGYAYLTKKALVRLMEEAVAEYILSRFKPVANVDLGLYGEYVARLSELVRERYAPKPEVYDVSGMGEEVHPPCMRVILSSLRSGKGLPHLARFAIVAYLRALGWDVESVVRLFSNVPDFNERITRYQVEHIFGLRGSGKVYSVPSCRTLKTGNLCYAGGNPICERINHPLQYVRRFARRGTRGGR